MKTGTKEWAETNCNIFKGCRNGCRYCFAREHAQRFGRIRSASEWTTMIPVPVPKGPAKPSRIMFPSTHDLFPDHLDIITPALRSWLGKGHTVLIVSKARLDVIKYLCGSLQTYRNQVIFRITIGSMNNEVLSFWEPGAPSYEERYDALAYAYMVGFETSVSCEPFLDNGIVALTKALLPYVSESLWIGKMNNVGRRVNTDGWGRHERSFLHRMLQSQHDDAIRELYAELKDNPWIRWKDSIKRVVGLPEEDKF